MLGLFHGGDTSTVIAALPFLVLLGVCLFWWRDVDREASLLGFHTSGVQLNILFRIVWFIISEVFFFFGFFWTFFYSSLNPVVEVRAVWPPLGVMALDPVGVPLLNTVVLLSSRLTVT